MSPVKTGKRVCFISSRTGVPAGEATLQMDWANGRLIDELSKQIPNLSVAIINPPGGRKASHDFTVHVKRVYGIRSPFSYAGGLLHTIRITKQLKKIEREHDILIIQLPFIGFLSLLFIRKPTVYHICANVLTAAANPVKYKGVRRIASMSFARIIDRVYHRLFTRNQTQVLANGEELGLLYRKYDAKTIVSSSLTEQDIISDSALTITPDEPIRIFFVGRPSLEKGFDTLINALSNFSKDFRLTVVGFTKNDFKTLLPEVYARSVSWHNKIDFKGYLTWQGGLKEIIRQQDIAIIPSRSEGTPRVIPECMSQGVAIIASHVGGIPTVVKDGVNGLLVEPGNAEVLQRKIMALGQDDKWRKKLILCALDTVRENTIEQFSRQFIQAIERLDNE